LYFRDTRKQKISAAGSYRKYQIGGNSFEIANIFEIETIISTVIGITALEVST
jgi:hypothetical protein